MIVAVHASDAEHSRAESRSREGATLKWLRKLTPAGARICEVEHERRLRPNCFLRAAIQLPTAHDVEVVSDNNCIMARTWHGQRSNILPAFAARIEALHERC